MSATAKHVRRDCLATLRRAVGDGGVEAFLRAPQPALGDRTGAELLESEPKALLERLRELERGAG